VKGRKNMKVNILSSAGKFPGQGVYSAYMDCVYVLKTTGKVEITENVWNSDALVQHSHTPDPKVFLQTLLNRRKSLNVVTAHVLPDSIRGSIRNSWILAPLFGIWLKWLYSLNDVVLAVSEDVADELQKKLKIKKEKIYVFPNYVREDLYLISDEKVKIEKARLRKELGFKDEDFIIVGAGQVQPRKGIKDFVEVAEKLPQFKFVWVGGNPFKDYTEGYHEMKKITENHPENVFFTGTVSREKVRDYYMLSDIMFLPSYQETFGLVIVEAAGSGLPLLLRDLQVYTTIFDDCYLKASDNQTFIDYIDRLSKDKDLYREMSCKARKLFEKYGSSRAGINLLEIYSKYYYKKFGKKLF